MTSILVVDDDRLLLDRAMRILEAAGYRVSTATCADEAIESFNADRPDLLIVDICLGPVDGAMLASRLSDGARRVPVLLMTSFPFEQASWELSGRSPARAPWQDDPAQLIKPFRRRELLRAVATSLGESEVTFSAGRILVVEDDPQTLVLVQSRLAASGYEVLAADCGLAALSEAVAFEPDVALVDLRLPDMSGMQVMEALRERFGTLPVIITTAHGSEEAAARAVRQGAADYLVKPVARDHLLTSIRAALTRGDGEAEARRLLEALKESVRTLQAALAETKARLQALEDAIRGLPVGLLLARPDGKLAYSNLAANRALGLDPPVETVDEAMAPLRPVAGAPLPAFDGLKGSWARMPGFLAFEALGPRGERMAGRMGPVGDPEDPMLLVGIGPPGILDGWQTTSPGNEPTDHLPGK